MCCFSLAFLEIKLLNQENGSDQFDIYFSFLDCKVKGLTYNDIKSTPTVFHSLILAFYQKHLPGLSDLIFFSFVKA